MSISSALDAANSGLRATSLRAEIVATNVANASTPGYVRRSVILSETIVGGETQGVRVDGIGQARNEALTAQRMLSSSELAQADVLASAWQTLSARIGDTADGTGIFSEFERLETSLATAVTTPESGTSAIAVLDAAQGIINEFQDLSALSANLRAEADLGIAEGVNFVNTSLKQIEDLNTRISGIDRTTEQAAAIRDERQRLIDGIAEYMPVTVVNRNAGKVDIFTPQGVALLAGTARELEFSPANTFGPEHTIASGTLSPLTVQGIELTPGSGDYGALPSGMFAGLFTLRDTDIPAFTSQLDALAGELVDRVSAAGIDPTVTAGDPGLFYDPDAAATIDGLAARFALNPAVDPNQGGSSWRLRDGLGATVQGPPGDSTILSNLYDALTEVRAVDSNGVQGAFSLTSMAAQLTSLTGQTRIQMETVQSSVQAQHRIILNAEQTESGVDVDQQMQELLLVEQAYAANARVIQAAQEMIRQLMEI